MHYAAFSYTLNANVFQILVHDESASVATRLAHYEMPVVRSCRVSWSIVDADLERSSGD